jgi:hypothetical protein
MGGETVIVTWVVPVHPAGEVTVTEYVVVAVGLATGFWQVVQLRPVAGDHAYTDPAVQVRLMLLPEQIVSLGVAVTKKLLATVTVTVAVLEHPAAV